MKTIPVLKSPSVTFDGKEIIKAIKRFGRDGAVLWLIRSLPDYQRLSEIVDTFNSKKNVH